MGPTFPEVDAHVLRVIMSTPVCELLGIERPVVLAAMVDIPRLAAAVSNAGGLGMVTLTWSADVGVVVR
jgi:nitronate monooxygenase